MASPSDTLQKLQTKVFFKNNKVKARDVEEISIKKPISTRYTDDREDDNVDVPDVQGADSGDYVTYRKIGLPGYTSKGNRLPLEARKVKKFGSDTYGGRGGEVDKMDARTMGSGRSDAMAGSPEDIRRRRDEYERTRSGWGEDTDLTEVEEPGMDPADEEVPTGPETEGGDEMAAGVDPGMEDPTMAADPGMEDPAMGGAEAGMGSEMGGMGMPGEEPPKEPKELGRIYELKKIYARLTSVEAYLSDASEPDLLKLRTLVSQSIEMFEILASNFDSYKDRLDEIIVMYYKFIDETYSTLREYYKIRSEEK
jgi:hypothetical protein